MNVVGGSGKVVVGNPQQHRAFWLLAAILVLFVCAVPVWAQEPGTDDSEVAAAETVQEETPWYDNELLFFLGRFHPIVLHFPVALLVVLLMAEVITLGRPQSHDTSVAKWLLLIVGSVTAVTAATFGLFLSWSGGYDADLTWWHKWTGISVAVLSVLATLLKTQYNRMDTARFRFAYWVVLLSAVGVLLPASHYGASMTHGSTYLTKYLPPELEFLRPILGVAKTENSSRNTEGLFAREILPILEAKCYECHSEEKQKGDYRIDDPEWCLEGGESELAAIVPGDAMASNLARLILLPEDDKNVMPPVGKPPLSPEERVALVRWIGRGAPFGAYEPPPPVAKKEEAEAAVTIADLDSENASIVALIETDEIMEILFEAQLESLRTALAEEPKGRKKLKAVYNSAYAIAEAHNLLFSRDDEEYMATPEWSALAVVGRDASEAIIDPLMAKDYAETKAAFSALVKTCNDCHEQFETSEKVIEDTIPSPSKLESSPDG